MPVPRVRLLSVPVVWCLLALVVALVSAGIALLLRQPRRAPEVAPPAEARTPVHRHASGGDRAVEATQALEGTSGAGG